VGSVSDAGRRDASVRPGRSLSTSPRTLAQDRAIDRGALTEYLAFRLAGDAFAAPVSMIREILKPPPITHVPRASREILGIVSVRGLVVTVLDLRRLLRLEESPLTGKCRILLVANEVETLGLLVDEVLEVHRLPESDVERASQVLGSDVSEGVAGIARPRGPRGEVIVLLDLRVLLP
jgi:purine-binding chemotaxis protein CheW